MLVDTHVHFPDSSAEIAAWVSRALDFGVDAMLAVGGSDALNRAACSAAETFPDHVALALGWDRSQAGLRGTHVSAIETNLARCKAQGSALGCIALGEIGLDYHHEADAAPAQRALFAAQMEEAARLGLPVIVHSRKAEDDTLAIIDNVRKAFPPREGGIGVLHCFTGELKFAEQLIERGFAISFSGIVSFRNADPLRAVAAMIPADRLLIETDAPYLAPVPYRGQINEPAYVARVAAVVAEARDIELPELAAITRANAQRLFGWPA